MAAAIAQQAGRLPTSASPFATEAKTRPGKLLAEVPPGDIKKTFFQPVALRPMRATSNWLD
ncbi:MAG: hypothetical protein JRG73_09735 [Deltaproteobacteria bacterium]|nr:hypothetical protein [Deltaproteobacteria bacterium]MBW2307204.1 hypothetical protein [Deltaproteobacteria bacterium]